MVGEHLYLHPMEKDDNAGIILSLAHAVHDPIR